MTSLSELLRRLAPAACFACALTALASAASATFWTVSSQADFLKGEVEDLSIDSDGRVFLGPAASLVGETSAPFLWSIVSGADGTHLGRQRQRGQGPEDRPRRQGLHLLRRDRARGARHCRGARRRPLRRDLAGRQDLPRGGRRHRQDLVRSRGQVHLGAGGRHGRQRSTPPPATRASSTRSRPTATARASTRPAPPTSSRWP